MCLGRSTDERCTAQESRVGWDTGEFDLTEEQVRGEDFIGERPLHGGHSSVSATMPYMLIEKNPEAGLFEGEYQDRLKKILTRYPKKRAALLPVLSMVQELRGHVSPESMLSLIHI